MKHAIMGLFIWLLLGAFACDSDEPKEDDKKEENVSTDTDTDTEREIEIPENSYSVIVNGKAQPVYRVDKFEVPVNYMVMDFPGETAEIEITSDESFSDYILSPKSRQLDETLDENTLSFTIDEPIYAMLRIPDQEYLFILIDPPESDPPSLDDSNVKNIMDYEGIDNTGEKDNAEIIQEAIDEASGAKQNILYFPPGIYASNMLRMKDDVTVYLAKGATLLNATPQAKLLSHPEELVRISEGVSQAFILMKDVSNAKVIGRGVVDGNGVELQSFKRKQFNFKIEDSTDCAVEGIVSLDSPFWNVFTYRSHNISIENFKAINNRLASGYNETDGVDFGNTTDSKLYNAFLYTGDDCMAVKSDDIPDDEPISGMMDTSTGPIMPLDNCVHEKVVCFSGSAACKVGTKTFGHTITDIEWKDIDVITADRALVIDAVDTATISGTVFDNIRVEHATGRLIDFNMDKEALFWRKTLGRCTVNDTLVKDVSFDSDVECRIGGLAYEVEDSEEPDLYLFDGITFDNFSIKGNRIESLDDSNAHFNVNDYVSNVTFL